jgi:hypothetical protein
MLLCVGVASQCHSTRQTAVLVACKILCLRVSVFSLRFEIWRIKSTKINFMLIGVEFHKWREMKRRFLGYSPVRYFWRFEWTWRLHQQIRLKLFRISPNILNLKTSFSTVLYVVLELSEYKSKINGDWMNCSNRQNNRNSRQISKLIAFEMNHFRDGFSLRLEIETYFWGWIVMKLLLMCTCIDFLVQNYFSQRETWELPTRKAALESINLLIEHLNLSRFFLDISLKNR